MKAYLIALVLLGAGAVWLMRHVEQMRLQILAHGLRDEKREHDALRQERERLLRLQSAATYPDPRPNGPQIGNGDASAPDTRAGPISVSPFSMGHWISAEAWQNRGSATPRAALETALWAAAGGDVAAFETILELDPEVEREAARLLSTLPDTARTRYTTPETLLAEFTIRSIPVGAAQLIWYHEPSPEKVAVALFLNNPRTATGPASLVPRGEMPDQLTPPQLADAANTQTVYLSLRRREDGWRLVVPSNAVQNIEQQLRGAR